MPAPGKILELVDTFERHAKATDRKIDRLVYGLTAEEIRIVEGLSPESGETA